MKHFISYFFVIINLLIYNGYCLEFEDDSETNFDNEFKNWMHFYTSNNNNNNNNDNGREFIWPLNHHSSRRSDEGATSSFTLSPPSTVDERDREPLEIDAISGSIGGNPDDREYEIETHNNRKPVVTPFSNPFGGSDDSGIGGGGLLIQHSFNPFLDQSLFYPHFGSFNDAFTGIRGPSQFNQWWNGPNVCTERKEEVEDFENDEDRLPSFGIHFSLNTCVEKSQKHICKTIVNQNGKKKTNSVTHQCCHGFGRSVNGPFNAPCEKIDLKSIIDTTNLLNGTEFISSIKKNGLEEKLQTNITIFLPTDNAFSDFTEQMLESNLVVLPLHRHRRASSNNNNNDVTGITTRELILNHIVSGWYNIEDIENEQLLATDYNNSTIRINVFPPPPNDNEYEYAYRYTANCAPITKINQIAENGIIHVIDRVLQPVRKNIMEIIRSRSDMAVLRTVLEKTNLADELEQQNKQFTLFAPNDRAFEKLDPHLRRTIKEGKSCALNILKNHILDITFCSVAVVDDVKTGAVNTIGIKMSLQRTDKKLVNGKYVSSEISDLTGVKDIVVNNEGRVLDSDIMATNGVLHIIDTVLTTESGMPVSKMLDTRNLTIFQELIQAGGYENKFDSMENVTFLIPIDKALEKNHWAELLDENPSVLSNNKDLLTFLEYHVVKPLTKTCDLDNDKMMESLTGDGVRVNLYSTHSVLPNIMNRATVNCGRLIHFDDETCGSVVHQIDKVLEPPKYNLLGALESNENYSMFLALLKAANLTDLLLNPDEALTLLVPSNEIFRELQNLYDDLLNNQDDLERIMKLHILNDTLCCTGIVRITWPFVRFVTTVNNIDLTLQRDVRPKIQNAGITKCDIITKNGIIHEVNEIVRINKYQKPSWDDFLNK